MLLPRFPERVADGDELGQGRDAKFQAFHGQGLLLAKVGNELIISVLYHALDEKVENVLLKVVYASSRPDGDFI
ncbi:hypothetical protein D3C71_2029910 [compost metagenome]